MWGTERISGKRTSGLALPFNLTEYKYFKIKRNGFYILPNNKIFDLEN